MSPDNALVTLGEWKTFIARAFTWLYQGSRAIFLFFIMFIVYKYGHVHLGEKDEKPEFSLFATLSMVITAGATNGLLVYSVLEPMSHQTSNFFAQSNFRSQDEISMNAINLTVTNWGLGGWAPYTIVAIAMSLAAYRFNLPMTYRSCFYPILGQYTWGWIGDMIDGTAIIVTLLGIFTNLGLAAMNIVAGFTYMGWIDEGSTDEHLASIQNSVVWLIIMISLASAISGLHGGIQYLCVFAMSLSAVLAFLVFSMDDTKFLANVQVQELGVYLQTSILQLNFWTDAFGQLHEGSGRAIDGQAAEVWWMETWMIFTQAWW